MAFGHHHRHEPDSEIKDRAELVSMIASAKNAEEAADSIIRANAIRWSPGPMTRGDKIFRGVILGIAVTILVGTVGLFALSAAQFHQKWGSWPWAP